LIQPRKEDLARIAELQEETRAMKEKLDRMKEENEDLLKKLEQENAKNLTLNETISVYDEEKQKEVEELMRKIEDLSKQAEEG
jgi:predicted nuclease with TOPRIM domain